MKVLLITQYFPPEIEIGGMKIFEISKKLLAMGVFPVVLTGYPNFPTGRIFPGFSNKGPMKEKIEKIQVIRVPIYPSHSLSVAARMANQMSFFLSALIHIRKIPKADILLATSPPLFVGFLGFLLARHQNIPFVFEIRDLWPESAIQVGLVKRSWITGIFDGLQSFTCRKCDRAVALTQGIKAKLDESGHPGSKVSVIRNGVDVNLFSVQKPEYHHRARSRKIKLGYIGTLSLIHGIGVLVDVAEKLKNENVEIHVTGDGVEKERLIRRIRDGRIRNVFIHDAVPKAEVPSVIHQMDIGLVTVKNIPFCKGTVPAKLFEYWACGKPVILAAEGEAQELAREADAALSVKPEDGQSIADAVLRLKNHPHLRKRLGQNGRRYVIRNSSRDIAARQYLEVFESAARNPE
jgi:glycosyltransferase involved in cell wall biosynthesis